MLTPMPGPTSSPSGRLPAGEYTAIIKPRLSRNSAPSEPGVLLVLKPPGLYPVELTFAFSSWDFLREHLLVFGFASSRELAAADVRLATGRQPYLFARRRWEAPLIEALDLHGAEA